MTDPNPLFTVTKGNPSDTEIAALTALLSTLAAEARSGSDSVRNLWGRREMPHRDTVFNPNAFRNVSFY